MFGYNRLDFERNTAIGLTGQALAGQRLYYLDPDTASEIPIYYYKHPNDLACYYCIIEPQNANLDNIDETRDRYGNLLTTPEKNKRKRAYYMALARERYELSKASDYINGSSEQRNI